MAPEPDHDSSAVAKRARYTVYSSVACGINKSTDFFTASTVSGEQ